MKNTTLCYLERDGCYLMPVSYTHLFLCKALKSGGEKTVELQKA